MASAVGPPSGSALAPQAVSGRYPRGVGGRGRSRALAAGAGGGGGAASVPPSYAARPRRRPGEVRPASSAGPRPARPGSVPAPAASPRRVGAGVSGRGRVVRARPRPGDACPGGDPRDAAASPAAARFPPGCGRAARRFVHAPRAGRRWAPVGGGRGRTASSVRRSWWRGRLAAAWRLCGVGGVRGGEAENGDGGRERGDRERVGSRSVRSVAEGGAGGRARRSGGDRRVFSPPPCLPRRPPPSPVRCSRSSSSSSSPSSSPVPPPPPPSSAVLPSVTAPALRRARVRPSVRPVAAGSCSRPAPPSLPRVPLSAPPLTGGGLRGSRCGGGWGRSTAARPRGLSLRPSFARSPRSRARPPRRAPSETRPQIRRGDPLNLSILVSGGKETNQDSLSNGE